MVATRVGSKDPVRDLAGGAVGQEVLDQVEADYPYLDKPLPVQYGYWLKDMVTGNMGKSYLQSQTVLDMFKQRVPPTFFIGFWAIFLGLLIALPVGVYSAYRRDGLFDRVSSLGSFASISTPPLVLAVLLVVLRGVEVLVLPHRLELHRALDQSGRALQELLPPLDHPRPRARRGVEQVPPRRHDLHVAE